MPKIFISYRRMDSQERAHRIADWLVLKFGVENVFIDVDHLGGGVDFAADISKSLEETDVLLVVIGKHWVDELRRRMEASAELDLVRFEVSKGLETVPLLIPVLLEEDIQIDPNRLPEDIRPLVKRNYRYVRLKDFHQDMEKLYTEIATKFEDKEETPQKSTSPAFLLAGLGLIGILAIIFLFITFGQGFLAQLSNTPTPENPETAVAQDLTAEAFTATPNLTGTYEALSTSIRTTATANAEATINAYTDTPTVTFTPSQTPSLTPNSSETAQAMQAATDERSTQNAQLTQNAPTNTPRPSNTPSPTSTFTPSNTPSPTPNLTGTAQSNINATATEAAFATDAYRTVEAEVAVQNAAATVNAAATRNTEATRLVRRNQLTATQASATQLILNNQATANNQAQSLTATQVVSNNHATATQRAFSTQFVEGSFPTLPGDFQQEIGCASDWSPDCNLVVMIDGNDDGIYYWTTTAIPIGNWEVKVAINGSWDENYGLDGEPYGDNIPFRIIEDNQRVLFTYNSRTHILTIEIE